MQILFLMEQNNNFSDKAMNDYLSLPQENDEIQILKERFKQKSRFNRKVKEGCRFLPDEEIYIRDRIPKILQNLEKIDTCISKHLKNWSFSRLAKVDLAILRVAVYEFLFEENIPGPVSIDEAVEISKIYSTEDSSKFINGILGSIYKKLEEEK